MEKKWFYRLLKPAATLAVCGGLIVFGGCNEDKPKTSSEGGTAPSSGGSSTTTSTTPSSSTTTTTTNRGAVETAPSASKQSGTPTGGTQATPPAASPDTSSKAGADQRSENIKSGARDEKAQETSYKADSASETTAGGADAQAAQTVRMMDQPPRYEPAKLTIAEGQTVEWRNEGKMQHSVTLDPQQAKNKDNAQMPEGAAPFDSGVVEPGSNFKHTFTKAGTYKYFCRAHEKDGMVGEITVTPKSGAQ
jgi:plastocyanin